MIIRYRHFHSEKNMLINHNSSNKVEIKLGSSISDSILPYTLRIIINTSVDCVGHSRGKCLLKRKKYNPR